jgi:hypothetical protein
LKNAGLPEETAISFLATLPTTSGALNGVLQMALAHSHEVRFTAKLLAKDLRYFIQDGDHGTGDSQFFSIMNGPPKDSERKQFAVLKSALQSWDKLARSQMGNSNAHKILNV